MAIGLVDFENQESNDFYIDQIVHDLSRMQAESNRVLAFSLPDLINSFMAIVSADDAIDFLTAFMSKPTIARSIDLLVLVVARKLGVRKSVIYNASNEHYQQFRAVIWAVLINETSLNPKDIAKIFPNVSPLQISKATMKIDEIIARQVGRSVQIKNSKNLMDLYRYLTNIWDSLNNITKKQE